MLYGTPPLPHFSPFVITQHPNLSPAHFPPPSSLSASSRVESGSRPGEHDSINQTPLKEEEEESLLRMDQQKNRVGEERYWQGQRDGDPLHPPHHVIPPPDCCRRERGRELGWSWSIVHRYILRYFGASSSSSLGIFAESSPLADAAKRYIEKLGQRILF